MIDFRMTGREWGMLIALSVLWGGSFLFMGIAVREIPFYLVAALRCLIGAAVLHLVLRAMGLPFPVTRPALIAFFGMGLLINVIPFLLIAFGQSRIESGLASILNATTPIFTILIAHFLTRDEKLNVRKGIGVLLGFFGVGVLFDVKGGAVSTAALVGQGACLLASLSYGFSGSFGKRFTGLGFTPLVAAVGQLTASSLLLVPVALLIGQPWAMPMPSLAAIGAVLALGVVSTSLAYLLFMRLLIRAGATNTSLVTLLIPCSAILFGAGFLGEALGVRQFIGFVIIASGLLAIDGRIFGLLGGRSK